MRRMWSEVYLAHEMTKVAYIRGLLQGCSVTLLGSNPDRPRVTVVTPHAQHPMVDGTTTTLTAAAPSSPRHLTIGCPPHKCDVLVARAALVDAMPESLLGQMSKT
eukprot:2622080-Pleurochrysis_carterae.AAC.1